MDHLNLQNQEHETIHSTQFRQTTRKNLFLFAYPRFSIHSHMKGSKIQIEIGKNSVYIDELGQTQIIYSKNQKFLYLFSKYPVKNESI